MATAARTLRAYGCKKLRFQSIVLLTKIDLSWNLLSYDGWSELCQDLFKDVWGITVYFLQPWTICWWQHLVADHVPLERGHHQQHGCCWGLDASWSHSNQDISTYFKVRRCIIAPPLVDQIIGHQFHGSFPADKFQLTFEHKVTSETAWAIQLQT